MKKKPHRQGDLLFVPIPKDSWQVKGCTKDCGYLRKDGVIQEGEATGHHHKLENLDTADVYRFDGSFSRMPIIVVGREGARVIHDEHGPIVLDPDTAYEVHIAREEDPTGAVRQVMD